MRGGTSQSTRLQFADASRLGRLVTQDAAELSDALPYVCAGFHCQVAPKVAPSTWCTSALEQLWNVQVTRAPSSPSVTTMTVTPTCGQNVSFIIFDYHFTKSHRSTVTLVDCLSGRFTNCKQSDIV